MRLDINTTQKKVYRQIVEIIRSIPPLDTLRNRELDVLAILMYYNYKYKEIKYVPDIFFNGKYECFTLDLPIQEIINYLERV